MDSQNCKWPLNVYLSLFPFGKMLPSASSPGEIILKYKTREVLEIREINKYKKKNHYF